MWWVGFWAKSRGRQGAQKLKRRPATAAVLAYRLTPEHSMEVIKASRHSKITGDFAEGLILYWLSKSGYECARVDHTGIDLIAADPEGKHRMGISVKSRCRTPGNESASVKLLQSDVNKASAACKAWGLTPYFAIVVDAASSGVPRAFLIPASHLESRNGKLGHWRMSEKYLDGYRKNEKVMHFSLTTQEPIRWKVAHEFVKGLLDV